MLRKIRELLSGPVPTVAKIDETVATIDLAALEAALGDAQQKRAGILLDGTVDDILAAERAVDTARIELERGQVTLAELERRRAEAEAQAKRDALEKQRADAQAMVDAAVAKIEAEYPAHAQAIVDMAKLAKEADEAARGWLQVVIAGRADGVPPVDLVAQRLGWFDEFPDPPDFADALSLPPAGNFNGYGQAAEWTTHIEAYALSGRAQPGAQVDKQMANGVRWQAAA